jgi:hypothetical protein
MSNLEDRLAERIIDSDKESGPAYPNLGPTVAKFRRQANPDPKAYGQAVRASIRALQRTELMREVSLPRCNCASGTNHTDGKAIRKAVFKQNMAKLHAASNGKPTFYRPDDGLREAYFEAILIKYGMDPVAVRKAGKEHTGPTTQLKWLEAAANVARRRAVA